jgi:hypothetical protein
VIVPTTLFVTGSIRKTVPATTSGTNTVPSAATAAFSGCPPPPQAVREPALLLGYAVAPEPSLLRAVAVLAEAVQAAI